jgi:gamma-glutamyl:cysteine ligase YbdK (ATP-grasp superfamily)
MTGSKLAISFFIALAFTLGCKSTADKPTNGTQQDPASAVQLAKAKSATLEATQAMEDYAYARKAEFVAKMTGDLVATQEELDRLAAKVASSAGTAKAEAASKLDAAGKKLAQTKQQLEQAKNATESSWNDVKSGFKESYAGLKDSIAATRLWLSEKIAP